MEKHKLEQVLLWIKVLLLTLIPSLFVGFFFGVGLFVGVSVFMSFVSACLYMDKIDPPNEDFNSL